MNFTFTARIFLLGVLSAPAFGFIPPVPNILKEVFDARRSFPGAEIVTRYQVKTPTGTTEVEERLIGDRNKGYITWRVGGANPVPAYWEKGQYVFPDGKRITSKSSVFNRYFLSNSSDEFRDVLLAERFLNKDQLLQYKTGFEATGDPATWDLKENYLIHPDIFLKRLPGGVGIAVVGTSDGQHERSIYFDKALQGVRRIEWKDGAETVQWTFDQFSGDPACPHRMTLEKGREELAFGEVVSCRWLKAKPYTDLIKAFRAKYTAVALPGEEALVTLLSYR